MGKTVILLPRSAERAQDSEGYVTDTVQRFIRCRATFKDTTRADEALASQDGYTASIICEIDRRNYSGQSWFEDADTGEIYEGDLDIAEAEGLPGSIFDSQNSHEDDGESHTYIVNKRSNVFHYPDCEGVAKMSDRNKMEFNGTRQEAIDAGYYPCPQCNP